MKDNRILSRIWIYPNRICYICKQKAENGLQMMAKGMWTHPTSQNSIPRSEMLISGTCFVICCMCHVFWNQNRVSEALLDQYLTGVGYIDWESLGDSTRERCISWWPAGEDTPTTYYLHSCNAEPQENWSGNWEILRDRTFDVAPINYQTNPWPKPKI
jgi:hypothetical protein